MRWLSFAVVVVVITQLALAQEPEKPKAPTPGEILNQLKVTSAAILKSFQDIDKEFSAGGDAIDADLREAFLPVPPTYSKAFSDLFLYKKEGKNFFGEPGFELTFNLDKSPLELNKAVANLLEVWKNPKATEKDLSDAFYRGHQAYWQTLAASYLYIEYLKRIYYYNRAELLLGGDDRAEFEVAIRGNEKSQGLDYLAQALIVVVRTMRTDAQFARFVPGRHVKHLWEDMYGKYYYFGVKDFDILKIGPVLNMEKYLYASQYPKLPEGMKEVPLPAPPQADDPDTLPTPKAKTPPIPDVMDKKKSGPPIPPEPMQGDKGKGPDAKEKIPTPKDKTV